jgi:release factor glutamine methyltransferase
MNVRETMLTAILNCDRTHLYVDRHPLNFFEQQKFEEMQNRFAAGEPLQYIIGFTEFMGLKINVDPRVLIPRPETEILVEAAMSYLQKMDGPIKILDLGTGSGNIAISLAHFLPDAHVTSIDVSFPALSLAVENAKLNGVREQIDFICMDMNHYLSIPAQDLQKFDLIISNPPYIPRESLATLPQDVKREPRMALDGGEDGLTFYRTIIQKALPRLAKRGVCLLEFGDGQHDAIQALVNAHPQFQIDFQQDYTDRFRIAQISYQPTTLD